MTKQPEVRILLGVWGEKFIHDFLELSFASLLAPGNIPALCQEYQTTFVFLTKSFDIKIFENHPVFPLLKKYCKVEFIPINDLIMHGNYSTTLTLAFDRAVREAGNAALNTYFMFLTSDYIVADGSFKNLIPYLQKGVSGIQTGNFQVTQDEIEEYLLKKIDPKTHVMQISPQELLTKSIKHLHAVTTTNFINSDYSHNYLANRFFYQYKDILGARFYLLHMLCIKPETLDYKIGASCDYSFIPEMCPSGNIMTITDSDEYFVIEAQPRDHELNNIKWGALNPEKLAKTLAEWTTAQHRKNAEETIFFHSKPLLDNDKKIIDKQLDHFFAPINLVLKKYKSQPFRNHPYWVGAISTLDLYKDLSHSIDTQHIVDLRPLTFISNYRRLLQMVIGTAPDVRRLHYRWREFTSIQNHIKKFVSGHAKKTVAIYHSDLVEFLYYSKWLKEKLNVMQQYNARSIIESKQIAEQLKAQGFERCILPIRVEELKKLPEFLELLHGILAENAEIIILIPNEKNHYQNYVYDVRNEFMYRIHNVINSPYKISNIQIIRDNFCFIGSLVIESIKSKYYSNRLFRFAIYGLVCAPGSILLTIGNLFSIKKKDKRFGHCTDLLITMQPNKQMESIS